MDLDNLQTFQIHENKDPNLRARVRGILKDVHDISRLEQRLGRIKRFGQTRRSVDMLNLVYHDTQYEKIYAVLSQRLKDKFNIFDALPDTIEDDWVETAEKLDAMLDQRKGR